MNGREKGKEVTHLVVEAALGFEVGEELAVRLAPPELHVRDLEVAPDFVSIHREREARCHMSI